jgi:hypothetical protein
MQHSYAVPVSDSYRHALAHRDDCTDADRHASGPVERAVR